MIIEKVIFIGFIILSSYSIIINIFFPKYFTKKRWKKTSKIGQYRYFINKSPLMVFSVYAFIIAYLHADLSLAWLVFAVVYILILGIGFIFLTYIKFENNQLPELTADRMKRSEKSRRYFSIWDIVVLILWIFSWRNIFIF